MHFDEWEIREQEPWKIFYGYNYKRGTRCRSVTTREFHSKPVLGAVTGYMFYPLKAKSNKNIGDIAEYEDCVMSKGVRTKTREYADNLLEAKNRYDTKIILSIKEKIEFLSEDINNFIHPHPEIKNELQKFIDVLDKEECKLNKGILNRENNNENNR